MINIFYNKKSAPCRSTLQNAKSQHRVVYKGEGYREMIGIGGGMDMIGIAILVIRETS
jgi:hypothetical protein